MWRFYKYNNLKVKKVILKNEMGYIEGGHVGSTDLLILFCIYIQLLSLNYLADGKQETATNFESDIFS